MSQNDENINSSSSPSKFMSDVLEFVEDEYKCSICIGFLRKPRLTCCGHKFCHSCIESWLSENQSCPICKQNLQMNSDTFPDKFTERKISELCINCPNAKEGCQQRMSIDELEEHAAMCVFSPSLKDEDGTILCPFSRMGCEKTFKSEKELEYHKKEFTENHLKIAMNKIVVLEKKISNDEKISKTRKDHEEFIKSYMCLEPVLKNNKFLWVIDNFSRKLENKLTDSIKFWSSIYGYGFTMQMSFEKKLLNITIFIASESYKDTLTWPCRIRNCRISVLRRLTNKSEDRLSVRVQDTSVVWQENRVWQYGQFVTVLDNSKNIIEINVNSNEIGHFIIDNKLWIQVYMHIES